MRRSRPGARISLPGGFFVRRCWAPTSFFIVINGCSWGSLSRLPPGFGTAQETGETMSNSISRRQILRDAATGFGSTALIWMLQQERLRAEQPRTYDLRPRKPDLPAKAKSVIYLYMGGGPSTIDMFDPKPLLKKYDGQDCPTKVDG